MKNTFVLLCWISVFLYAVPTMAADKVIVIPLFKSNTGQCPDGLTNCSGSCVDTINNPDFCGDCETTCGVGSHCSNGSCTKPLSDVCSTASECVTGYCVDGVCCNAACNFTCESCISTDTGGIDGVCGYITSNTDPYNECGGSDVCNGSGTCVKLLGEACAAGSDCLSGNCVDGVCCDTSCSSTCKSCIAIDTGGVDGVCGDITTNTDPYNECGGSDVCSGGFCVKLLGEACSIGKECLSDNCVDGVCCNTSCSSSCESCIGAKTGGVNGTCKDIIPFTDPDNECSGSLVCGVSGACGKPLGESCSTGSECSSKICADKVCCDTTCSSTCESCLGSYTGGITGTCDNITDGSDPFSECGTTHFCNGNGGCQSCFDSIKNGLEDDVDCGNPACGEYTCTVGNNCDESLDCTTKYCDPKFGICQ